MKAITRHRYGGPDTLELEELPPPRPGAGEVLVAVRAAGVRRDVWHLLTGRPYLVRAAGFGLLAPRQPILGRDVAGTVEAVGPGVTRFAPGDAVFGFADHAVAAEDHLAPMPASLCFAEAAALPVAGTMALQAAAQGRIRPGHRVAITGASGGVGSLAVQISVARGAEVTGVASSTKLDLVRTLGAAHVVDHTRDDLTRRRRTFDVIIDVAGNRHLRDLRRALTRNGRLVIVGGEDGDLLTGGTHRHLRARLVSPHVKPDPHRVHRQGTVRGA